MPSSLVLDARLAELAYLDVVDVQVDGTLRLNEAFVDECVRLFEADASCLGTVVMDQIVARAVERGFAGCVDAEELALAALELGAAEESSAEA